MIEIVQSGYDGDGRPQYALVKPGAAVRPEYDRPVRVTMIDGQLALAGFGNSTYRMRQEAARRFGLRYRDDRGQVWRNEAGIRDTTFRGLPRGNAAVDMAAWCIDNARLDRAAAEYLASECRRMAGVVASTKVDYELDRFLDFPS
jgi:hypothetical protein